MSYVESLPADLARPGYPESLRLTFADTVVTTSRPSIGVPSVPARFSVATEGGQPLAFQFTDRDGDGTLSRTDESVVVLTPDPASGSLRESA